ncbi:MAG TPA: DUF5675 family protein [Gemmatimonadaceae bacterium]|nr:DUF5675 family protein [Gemmatimonadaceae bacterium]
MSDLLLKRVALTPDANYGVLIGPHGIPFAVTLELPWRDNKTNVSGIPQGRWRCERTVSPTFGETFEIIVPDRDHVLFHPANVVSELRGCVAVGHGFDFVMGDAGIVNSRKEFAEFMRLQRGVDAFTLHVINT